MTNRHEKWELRQMQSLPLEAKIIKASSASASGMNIGKVKCMYHSQEVKIVQFCYI